MFSDFLLHDGYLNSSRYHREEKPPRRFAHFPRVVPVALLTPQMTRVSDEIISIKVCLSLVAPNIKSKKAAPSTSSSMAVATAKSKPKRAASPDSDESTSESETSAEESEEPPKKPEKKPEIPVEESDEDSDTSDEDSDDNDMDVEKPKSVQIKAPNNAPPSEDEDSEFTDKKSESEDGDSDSEDSASGSSESDGSDSESTEGKKATKKPDPAPVDGVFFHEIFLAVADYHSTVSKKRKAEAHVPAPPKKVKLENGISTPAVASDDQETKGVFVGKLSWNVDDDWLAQEFASCGEIESAHVQMDRTTGRSRGFGHVHFTSVEAVQKALAMDGKEIDGRAIHVDKSNPPNKKAYGEKRAQAFNDKQSPSTNVLFVGNLSFDATEDALWEVFGEHGDVNSVRLPTDRESGKPRGIAYVEFREVQSAQKALNSLQGFELAGRSIRLDFSQPRDASGPGGRGGRPVCKRSCLDNTR